VNFADTLEAPMNAYPDFPLSMALQNYMPVILSGIGLFLVARMVSAAHAAAGRLALAGAALIVVAGTLKASWKLVMALSRLDLPLLSQSLFPLIAPGFTLMAWALFWSQQIISTISNAGFAWAAWTMVRAEPKLRPLTARSLHQAP
jgi:hypothetical protein